ncbi:MAG: alpha/beta fold hydrolase [Candidatus Rariloculaceae bacterium]
MTVSTTRDFGDGTSVHKASISPTGAKDCGIPPCRQGMDRTAYGAPFDSEDATAGALRWPWMLPFAQPEAGAAERQAAAFAALASWDKPAHVIFGDRDQGFTPEWGRQFAAHIPGATFDTVEGAGHFVQETGAPLAELILRRISEE